jgi:protein-S-isoprenylcysteine O-methyltransferase Ste14
MSSNALAARLFFQSALLPVVLGGLATVAAGSLDFPLLWVYAAVLFVGTMTICVYLFTRDRALLARRLKLGEKGEARPAQRVIVFLSGAAFFGIFVVAGLDRRFGWSRVPLAASYAANAVVALGFAIVFSVFRANTFTSSVVEVEAGQHVVSTGPYRFVRHPMYSGAILVMAATPAALGSAWAEILVVPLVLLVVARLRDEEALLTRDLRGYAEYTQATRYRLVPWIW